MRLSSLLLCILPFLLSTSVNRGDQAASSETCSSEDDATCGSNSNDCRDDDEEVCQKRHKDCDSDPSFMLRHCRKTCAICTSGEALEQNAGFGKLPIELSIQVLQLVRRTNLYFINHQAITTEHGLVDCRDSNTMCAFWAFQGQCTNNEFVTYMDHECPLTCQRCVFFKGQAFLSFLLEDLSKAYETSVSHHASTEDRDVVANRHRSLVLLMTTVGMDPSLLSKQLDGKDGNWLEELHRRVYALIPAALLSLYKDPSGPITDDELDLLASLHGIPGRTTVLNSILMPYRSRGYIVSIMRDFDHLITRPIQLGVGFAVPNEAALQKLEDLSPIVQVGAGAGYWAALLQKRGVDVVAYDINPPGGNGGENVFFDVAYMDNIHPGSCTDIFGSNATLAQDRSLLLIWPNDPDPVDNPQFCGGSECQGSQPVWDTDCLLSFMGAGGRRVIYVGEQESKIQNNVADGLDSGISSTRRFQQLLKDHFVLVDSIQIPNWWLNEDDMTVWERRLSKTEPVAETSEEKTEEEAN